MKLSTKLIRVAKDNYDFDIIKATNLKDGSTRLRLRRDWEHAEINLYEWDTDSLLIHSDYNGSRIYSGILDSKDLIGIIDVAYRCFNV